MTKTRFNLLTRSSQEANVGLGQNQPAYPRRRAITVQESPLGFEHVSPGGPIMLLVKAVGDAIVYQDMDLAMPIPNDHFIPVELNGTITQAIMDGDLVKEGKPYMDLDTEEQRQARRAAPRRQPRHARPGSTGSAPQTGPGV